MRRFYVHSLLSFLWLVLSACEGQPQNTSPDDYAYAQVEGEQGYALVLEGLDLNEGLRIIGDEWNDVWIRDCTISGTRSDGIFIRDVENLRVSGCEISEVEGQAGIRLSASGGSSDVLIENNHIHDVAENGINASQRFDDDVHHRALKIIGNRVERSGLEGGGGLTHGLYIQSAGHLISNNIIRDAGDGNGISVRSSGVVRNNQVYGYAQSGIRYFSDHHAGEGGLLIENNMVAGSGSGAAIEALFSDTTPESYRVSTIELRFNTALSNGQAALEFDTRLSPSTDWRARGNLILADELARGFELADDNIVAELDDFVSLTETVDLHLRSAHSTRGSVDGIDAPAEDIDGQTRPNAGRDPGADQFN